MNEILADARMKSANADEIGKVVKVDHRTRQPGLLCGKSNYVYSEQFYKETITA